MGEMENTTSRNHSMVMVKVLPSFKGMCAPDFPMGITVFWGSILRSRASRTFDLRKAEAGEFFHRPPEVCRHKKPAWTARVVDFVGDAPELGGEVFRVHVTGER